MASWQARLTNLLLRLVVKPGLRRQVDLRPDRIDAVRRRGVWCARWLVKPLKGTRVHPVREDGVRGEWVQAAGARDDRAVLFVHGGGFIIGSPAIYRHLVSRLSQAAGCAVFSLDYRLAPENPYPSALEDVLRAWRWLTSGPLGPGDVAAAGDSAGGNLVLAALLRLDQSQQPLPVAVVTMAPWTDLSVSGGSVSANRHADPYIPAELLRPVASAYLRGADPQAPEASPLFGDFSRFPPMLIHVGSTEVLLDDARRLERSARQSGVDVTLKSWQGLPHVFQLFSPFVPEGRRSLRELGGFLQHHLAG
ncbi:MAG TPA: alpha/beta hydrolase [Gammaproteobacteria bacterium]|nr:alpha/beta hydrolase [Gammaproteobacteria bacterium]